jgi:hypothetical protein
MHLAIHGKIKAVLVNFRNILFILSVSRASVFQLPFLINQQTGYAGRSFSIIERGRFVFSATLALLDGNHYYPNQRDTDLSYTRNI